MSTQPTPGEWLHAETDFLFIYALNEAGYNRFNVRVDGGFLADGSRTGGIELAANARAIGASKVLLEAVVAIDDAYESLRPYSTLPPVVAGQHDPYSLRRQVRAARIRAAGETIP